MKAVTLKLKCHLQKNHGSLCAEKRLLVRTETGKKNMALYSADSYIHEACIAPTFVKRGAASDKVVASREPCSLYCSTESSVAHAGFLSRFFWYGEPCAHLC
jgi:hypothetical protein